MDMPVYYDDSECEGNQCFTEENSDDLDYDYAYEQETLIERYQNCVQPTLEDTFYYLVPLLLTSLVVNVLARIGKY